MNNIHASAIVSGKAKLGENIIVHPFAIIEDDVEIGNDCEIGPAAVIYNGARIGDRVKIHQSASIANVPQDLKFANEKTLLIIKDDTIIRECAVISRGTKETGLSTIGNNCLVMAYAHIAHDCTVGDNCIIVNGVQIAGHVTIEDYVIIGGLTGVHQFCKIGQHVMVASCSSIVQDVPPYILAANKPLSYCGLNVIGLRRRGFTTQDIEILKKIYGYIYSKSLNISQAKVKILNEFGEIKLVNNVLDFISKSKRGLAGK